MAYQSDPDDRAERHAKWFALRDAPWSAPTSLDGALSKAIGLPAIWLNQAVDIMAFGDGPASSDLVEVAARRCQASRELCQVGARNGLVSAIGNPDQPGDGSIPIPRAYFDVSRRLGAVDNSLTTDEDRISDDEFTAVFVGNHQEWFNVRVETQSLLKWLLPPVEPSGVNNAPATAPVKKERGKIPAVVRALEEMFPKSKYPNGVPDPTEVPRKMLAKDLTDQVRALGNTLDPATLKAAIDRYNNSL